jgi:hypothetical protein
MLREKLIFFGTKLNRVKWEEKEKKITKKRFIVNGKMEGKELKKPITISQSFFANGIFFLLLSFLALFFPLRIYLFLRL